MVFLFRHLYILSEQNGEAASCACSPDMQTIFCWVPAGGRAEASPRTNAPFDHIHKYGFSGHWAATMGMSALWIQPDWYVGPWMQPSMHWYKRRACFSLSLLAFSTAGKRHRAPSRTSSTLTTLYALLWKTPDRQISRCPSDSEWQLCYPAFTFKLMRKTIILRPKREWELKWTSSCISVNHCFF